MGNSPISRIKSVLFGAFLLGYSACSSSAQEKETAYQTIEGTLKSVCQYVQQGHFRLSRDLLFCGQNVCVDNTGISLPKPGEKCANDQRWGARYGWDGIKAAHSREFRGKGCVDIESIFQNSYSPREDFCAIYTPTLEQAQKLANAINVYVD